MANFVHINLKSMKKIFLTLGLLLNIGLSFAQQTLQATYSYQIPDDIQTMNLAPGGILLVGSDDGLTAIEAHKKEVLYQYNAMGKLKPEEVSLIPGTPYVILTRGYSKVILDYFTGKEVFNSYKAGWVNIVTIKSDFPAKRIYVLGSNGSGYSFGAYDIETLENKGLVSFTDKKTMGSYINLYKYYESEGKLFIRTEKGIVCLDKEKFTIDWTYDDLEKTSSIINVLADPVKGEYYVGESDGKKHFLHKLDATGKRTTKKPSKLAGMPQRMVFTEKGLFSHSADLKTTYFQIFDRQTAMGIWKKPFKIKGGIFMAEITSNGVVYSTTSGGINTIDLITGKQLLKKDIKTGIFPKNVNLLPNDQIFFLTTKDMGVASLKTGEYVKEPTKFKKVSNMISAYDSKNDNLVVSTGTELFFIKKDGSSKKVMDLNFKEDETPNKIEFRETGILVNASQNAILLSYDGKLIYQSYYKAPGQSLAAKIALGALTAAMATQSVNQGMAGNYKDSRQSGKAGDDMMGEMNKKFKATATTKDHLYILTKLEDGIGLIKFNKNTGKKDAEIILKDKKPEYKVDDQFGVLYYLKDKKLITAFDLR